MSYKNAAQILPPELLVQVQQYIDGEFLYIPRRIEHKKPWGDLTGSRRDLTERNRQICLEHQNGRTIAELAEQYYLSEKSIERILYQGRTSV